MDSKFLGDKSPVVRLLAKVAEFVGFSMLSRKFPRWAAPAAMAGVVATIGAEWGTRLGGGVAGGPKEVATKGIAEMLREDESMGVLLTNELRGMGIVIQGSGSRHPATAGGIRQRDRRLHEPAGRIRRLGERLAERDRNRSTASTPGN